MVRGHYWGWDLGQEIRQFLIILTVLCAGLAAWMAGLGTVGFFWSWWTDRQRDPRVAAVVGLRCTVLLCPLVWINLIAIPASYFIAPLAVTVPLPGNPQLYTCIFMVNVALSMGLVAWALLRIRTHVKDVRYCNT